MGKVVKINDKVSQKDNAVVKPYHETVSPQDAMNKAMSDPSNLTEEDLKALQLNDADIEQYKAQMQMYRTQQVRSNAHNLFLQAGSVIQAEEPGILPEEGEMYDELYDHIIDVILEISESHLEKMRGEIKDKVKEILIKEKETPYVAPEERISAIEQPLDKDIVKKFAPGDKLRDITPAIGTAVKKMYEQYTGEQLTTLLGYRLVEFVVDTTASSTIGLPDAKKKDVAKAVSTPNMLNCVMAGTISEGFITEILNGIDDSIKEYCIDVINKIFPLM